MKKLLALVIALTILPIIALADLPDISGLSFDELVKLKEQINLAIWNSNEWQEVEVPFGTWIVGQDIPEGHWTVKLKEGTHITYVAYCDEVDEFNKPVLRNGRDHTLSEGEQWDIEMKEGMFFYTNQSVIFTPYAGKPDLGFH